MKHKVEGHDSLYKDSSTHLIVNRNTSERDRYRIAKQQALKNMESQQEISELKDEMKEIKSLLKQILK